MKKKILSTDENGLPHSFDDQPSVIGKYNQQSWYSHGKLHRVDGPAVIWKNGTEEWYQNGKRHRENGPAVTVQYGKKFEYWIQGKKHRIFGPAIEFQSKCKRDRYYVYGIHIPNVPNFIFWFLNTLSKY